MKIWYQVLFTCAVTIKHNRYVWRVWSSGMGNCAVYEKCTDISKDLPISIIRHDDASVYLQDEGRNFHQMYNCIRSHKTAIFLTTTTNRMPKPTKGLLLLILQIQENMMPAPCTLAHCQTRNMKTVIFTVTITRTPKPTSSIPLHLFQTTENMVPVPRTLAYCQTKNIRKWQRGKFLIKYIMESVKEQTFRHETQHRIMKWRINYEHTMNMKHQKINLKEEIRQ